MDELAIQDQTYVLVTGANRSDHPQQAVLTSYLQADIQHPPVA